MYCYFELRSVLYAREKNQSLCISLREIQNLWNVTIKNVKYRLHRLIEEGYIEYIPGKGRGNLSQITFCNNFKNDVISYVENSIKRSAYIKVFELFSLPISRDWILSSTQISEKILEEITLSKRTIIECYYNINYMKTLNPFLSNGQYEQKFVSFLGDSLFYYDEILNCYQPSIAHYCRPSSSYKSWIFNIRKHIQFHNGIELTAEDVIWSLLEHKKRNKFKVFSNIKNINYISKYKFDVKLDSPVYYFDRYLANPSLIICQKNTGINSIDPVMSGAFKLIEYSSNQITIKSNKNYFKGTALIDQIKFNQRKKNRRHYRITTNKEDKKIVTKKILKDHIMMLLFNFQKDSIIQNKYFREAMKYLFQSKEIKKRFPYHDFEDASSFSIRNTSAINYEPKSISSLLKKSGYIGETLVMHTLDDPLPSSYYSFFDFIIEYVKRYGINLIIEKVSFSEYDNGRSRKEADLFFGFDTPFTCPWLSFISLFNDNDCFPSNFLSKKHLSIIESFLDIKPQYPSIEEIYRIRDKVEDFIRSENLIIFLLHPYVTFEVDNKIIDFGVGDANFPLIKKLWIDE
ncbi:MAG: hypothetical protein GY756_02280 [bacterium]|nr:hypothetical protein [bacterium]